MVYAYKCGCKFFYTTLEEDCKTIDCSCGESHDLIPTALKDEPNNLNVVPDTLHNEMDYAAGRKFSTRTERMKYYKENGLNRVSRAEKRRSLDCTGSKPFGPVSYTGQKNHKSRV